MQFQIPCSTFVRLANAVNIIHHPNTEYLRSIYLEYRNGKAIAVASNCKIAAIEYFYAVPPEFDQKTVVTISPKLLEQCKTEAPFESVLTIVANPDLSFTAAKTSLGFNLTDNIMQVHPEAMKELSDWRNWFPDRSPDKTDMIALYMNAEDIANLGRSSPSGRLMFPTHYTADQPVIVRDELDEKWCGLFMPSGRNTKGEKFVAKPAQPPEWIA